jgi:pseudouridine synthase
MKIYLQQFLSTAGVASRRGATDLIKEGKVKINGKRAVTGAKVDPATDKVFVSGKLIHATDEKLYYLVNKPVGFTCTTKDIHARDLVTDLVPKTPKVWPVGRLDKDSHGLIMLTNDGELTNNLTHPKFGHEKEYIVTLDKPVTKNLLLKLKKGVTLKEGTAKADRLKELSPTKLSIVIHQGWNRQIRRMIERRGYKVLDLERIKFGKYKLDNLEPGQFKKI